MGEEFHPGQLRLRDLRRLVGEMWTDERCDPFAATTLDVAFAADAKSLDRTVITAYLRHFPRDHPSFEKLRAAAELSAGRRDWPWRIRGETWRLWDAEAGPERLAHALLTHDHPADLLRDAGLDGDAAQGEYVAEAVEVACDKAADARGEQAQSLGERLISLFDALAIGGQESSLAWALLLPWIDRNPPDDYRDHIAKLLVGRIGDPRLNRARWEALAAEMPDLRGLKLIELMRRWLTQRTVRQFFAVVGATTNDPRQWSARETFWLAYLDAGLIDDAWFAFGRQAELLAGDEIRAEGGLSFGEITGAGADPSHSALMMSIGDVRIAEWSHNGSCRFWDRQDRNAPELYKKHYFAMQLRDMNGGRGFTDRFAAIPHTGGWQPKFAGKIYALTGVQHPRHGAGY